MLLLVNVITRVRVLGLHCLITGPPSLRLRLPDRAFSRSRAPGRGATGRFGLSECSRASPRSSFRHVRVRNISGQPQVPSSSAGPSLFLLAGGGGPGGLWKWSTSEAYSFRPEWIRMDPSWVHHDSISLGCK